MTPQERLMLLRERERAVTKLEAVRSGAVWPWDFSAIFRRPELIKATEDTIKTIDEQLGVQGEDRPDGAIDAGAQPDSSQRMSGVALHPVIWLATRKAFEKEFGKLFEQGAIRAANKADAVQKAAQHFVGRDGKSLVSSGSSKSGQGPDRLLWLRPKVDVGEFLLGLYSDRKILGANKLDAVRQAAAHFICLDGKPLNAESLLETVSRRRVMREGKR